jgi:hypothetical protein
VSGYELDMDRIIHHGRQKAISCEINSSMVWLDLSAGIVQIGIDQAGRARLAADSIRKP